VQPCQTLQMRVCDAHPISDLVGGIRRMNENDRKSVVFWVSSDRPEDSEWKEVRDCINGSAHDGYRCKFASNCYLKDKCPRPHKPWEILEVRDRCCDVYSTTCLTVATTPYNHCCCHLILCSRDRFHWYDRALVTTAIAFFCGFTTTTLQALSLMITRCWLFTYTPPLRSENYHC